MLGASLVCLCCVSMCLSERHAAATSSSSISSIAISSGGSNRASTCQNEGSRCYVGGRVDTLKYICVFT